MNRYLYHLVAFVVIAIWGSTFVFTKLLLLGGSLCPLFASAIIGLFYKTERLSRLQTFGTLMAAAGVIVVVMNGHFVLHLSPRGDLLAFAACLCWAIYSLLMIPANARYDTVFVTRKVFFYGLLSMIPYYIIYPELNLHLVLQQPQLLWNLLFLGCVASMLCFLTWNWVLKKLGAVVATNKEVRSCRSHQLCVSESCNHHYLCLVSAGRANHVMVPPWHHPRSLRHVPGR